MRQSVTIMTTPYYTTPSDKRAIEIEDWFNQQADLREEDGPYGVDLLIPTLPARKRRELHRRARKHADLATSDHVLQQITTYYRIGDTVLVLKEDRETSEVYGYDDTAVSLQRLPLASQLHNPDEIPF